MGRLSVLAEINRPRSRVKFVTREFWRQEPCLFGQIKQLICGLFKSHLYLPVWNFPSHFSVVFSSNCFVMYWIRPKLWMPSNCQMAFFESSTRQCSSAFVTAQPSSIILHYTTIDRFSSRLLFRKYLKPSALTNYVRFSNAKDYWATTNMHSCLIVQPMICWLSPNTLDRVHSATTENHSSFTSISLRSSSEFNTKVY